MRQIFFALILIAGFSVCLGCADLSRRQLDVTPEQRAKTIATSYVQRTFSVGTKVGPTTAHDGYTSVWVWHVPAGPGGFTIVDVSDDGKVVGVSLGR